MAKKILGLDLGTNSIGWALIEENKKLIDAGSRIFPEGVNRDKSGLEVSKNETRRLARQIRRQYFRRKMRKMHAAKLLMANGMFPQVQSLSTKITEIHLIEPLRRFFALNPYELRSKAAQGHKLELMELGRIFYQLSQRRGYKGTLLADVDEEGVIFEGKPEENKPGINITKQMAEKFGTLGIYLNSLDPLMERKRNRYVGRDLYVKEFNTIWDQQKEYYPGVLTDELRFALGDVEKGILFFQRGLRSQKSKVGRCVFEKDKPRCQLSHPLFELSRILQFVNNIVIDGIALTSIQKDTVLDLMTSESKNFDFVKIKKKLKVLDLSANYDDKFKAPGSPFLAGLKKILGKQQFDCFDYDLLERLWNVKVFATDKDWLKNHVIDKFNFDDKTAEGFCSIRLPKGYGSLSRKALLGILEFLKIGSKYHEAVWLAGIRRVFNDKWDALSIDQQDFLITNGVEILNKPGVNSVQALGDILKNDFGVMERDLKRLYHHSDLDVPDGSMDQLPPFSDNIRNPLVQQTIQELRKLVNAIIKEYGKPDQIVVEMSRELKLPAEERKKLLKKQFENEERNTKAKDELSKLGLPPTGNNVLKFKLYMELSSKNGTAACPYTGTTIRISDLFDDNLVQVEHIIPYSISLDDSFANKTLCMAATNNAKGDRTPFQFFGSDHAAWEDAKTRAKSLLPYKKYERFIAESNPALNDFISRQLNDNRYSSRIALTYLQHVCSSVRVSRGELTSKLRRQWGLDGILSPSIPVTSIGDGAYVICLNGENEILEIKSWDAGRYKQDLKSFEKKGLAATGYVKSGQFYFDKQRDDHRHHAIDAIVVACSTIGALQNLSKLHHRFANQKTLMTRFNYPMPWDTFYGEVRNRVLQILVSYKKRIRATTPVHKKVDIVVRGVKTHMRSQGLGARGELHKESVYGRYGSDDNQFFHIRKGLENFTAVKDLDKIVDYGIRLLLSDLVKSRLGVTELEPGMAIPNDTFFGRDGSGNRYPKVFLPNANGPGIPIYKVRIREKLGKAVQLHDQVNQWVNPRNNHHVIIGLDASGKPLEKVVSFWEVVERKSKGGNVFEKPSEFVRDIVFMQMNDMFLFPTIEQQKSTADAIYRVQKLSDSDYTFRKTTATLISNPNEEIRIVSYKRWLGLSPQKVRIDVLGRIKSI
jgi:CRISPR-associated endonuclease Csn1